MAKKVKRNRNWYVVLAALIVTGLMFASAYSIATNFLWPIKERSAYYLVAGVKDNLPQKRIEIPMEIFIVESQTSKVRYSDSDLTEIVAAVNVVWRNNANITFDLIGINHINVPDDRVAPEQTVAAVRSLGRDYIGSKYADGVIDVIIVPSIKGLPHGGGQAAPSVEAVLSSEFDDMTWAKWNLAHELGHLLKLLDVIQRDNMMQWDKIPGNVEYKIAHLPVNLTPEQVLTTRVWAYNHYCAEESCIRND